MAPQSRTPIPRPAASAPVPAAVRRRALVPHNASHPAPHSAPHPASHRASPAAGHRVGRGCGFWLVAAAFAVLMGFGTAPTPLWPLYGARDGFGATTTTVVFAMLVVGASAAFLALGHLSDRLGRRRVVIPALAVGVAAGLVLALWTDLPGLVVGRLLNGIGIGLMASTATTYLHDLYHQEHPDRHGAALPGVVATAANLGGLALGPLAAGAVAQWLPHPLTVVQLGFTAALAIALLLVAATPETVHPKRTAETRPARFELRPDGSRSFGSAAGLGFFSFALFGVVTSLGSVMLHGPLGISSTFVAGVAPFLMFMAATVSQLALAGLSPARQTAGGLAAFLAGLALVAVALDHPTLPLYLIAVALAGAGAGLLFKTGVSRAVAAAAPASAAGVLAVYFVIGYLGMGIPSILFSVVIRHLSIETSMIGFALVLSAGAALAVAAGRRGPASGR